jgi:hypothetical protein
VLRPARPCLATCLGARAAQLGERRLRAGVTLRAMASCERRIDDARARVFAADDGIVTRTMTDLEREWRKLSSPDPEAGLMDLWALVAPPAWVDRKRYRDTSPDQMLDALVALASDPHGVEEAERAVLALVQALRSHGVEAPSKVVWSPLGDDTECLTSMLEAPLHVARAACPRKIETRIAERADSVGRELASEVLARHPTRPHLAADLAAAARLDFVWQAASLAPAENPAAPVRALYGTGYVLAAVNATSVSLAFPPL